MTLHSATMMQENLEKAADRVDFELAFLSEADHAREVAALEIYLLQIAERLRISREGK